MFFRGYKTGLQPQLQAINLGTKRASQFLQVIHMNKFIHYPDHENSLWSTCQNLHRPIPQQQQLRCCLHVKQPKCEASLLILPLTTRSRSRTSRGSWSAPSVRSSSPTRWSCPASTASATSVSGSCWCSTMRTPSTPAPSAPCRAAPGPGCRPPPWRGWTGLWDQVGLGVRNQNIHFSVGCISLFFSLQEGFYCAQLSV